MATYKKQLVGIALEKIICNTAERDEIIIVKMGPLRELLGYIDEEALSNFLESKEKPLDLADDISFSLWIKKARKSRGMSQQEFSKLAEISQGCLSELENLASPTNSDKRKCERRPFSLKRRKSLYKRITQRSAD